MKKMIITILLVLPFVLIYFISFTGQILSKYTHIYVERIVVVDSKGDEYEEGDYIKINKDEVYNLNIKVFPELASDKRVTISNSDKGVCSVDSKTHEVVGLEYGISKIIITSIDRHYVQYIININVVDEDITAIETESDEITLTKGKTKTLDVTIIPRTTLSENRNLVWSSDDNVIATVENGVVKGMNVGTTYITVSSAHKPSVFKRIKVTVTSGYGEGIFFDNESDDKIYVVNSSEFDLKTITIVNIDGCTTDDVWYDLINIPTAGAVDISRLDEGIIKFNKQKEIAIVSIYVYHNDVEYSDKIKIWYVQA